MHACIHCEHYAAKYVSGCHKFNSSKVSFSILITGTTKGKKLWLQTVCLAWQASKQDMLTHLLGARFSVHKQCQQLHLFSCLLWSPVEIRNRSQSPTPYSKLVGLIKTQKGCINVHFACCHATQICIKVKWNIQTGCAISNYTGKAGISATTDMPIFRANSYFTALT